MLLVYTFFFNLLVSQFCGVQAALANDVTGYARLARGEIIVGVLQDARSMWNLCGIHLDVQRESS